jgi:hypothetical protein
VRGFVLKVNVLSMAVTCMTRLNRSSWPDVGVNVGNERQVIMSAAKSRLDTYENEHRRAEQLGVNCTWLIEKMDQICYSLCPGFVGTWQQRAEKAALKAAEIANTSTNTAKPVKRTRKRIASTQTVRECRTCGVLLCLLSTPNMNHSCYKPRTASAVA